MKRLIEVRAHRLITMMPDKPPVYEKPLKVVAGVVIASA